jgi:tRNA (guanine10-N2)-methyltransferase
VLLARHLLKPRGRLVFFLPTVTDEYEDIDVQTLLCDGMEVIANSLQDFGSWGRRVSDSAQKAARSSALTTLPAHYHPENNKFGLL